MGNMAFYLKINRIEDYAFRCLSNWIEVACMMKYDCYIVCDKDSLKNQAKTRIPLSVDCKFIKSIKGESTSDVIEHVISDRWRRMSYAHLTPFVHSYTMGYDAFWSIDADDTMFCLSIKRISEALKYAEEYAVKHKIDFLSLDMHRSHSYGVEYSFGISFGNAKINWLNEFQKYIGSSEVKNKMKLHGAVALDWMVKFLEEWEKEISVDSFCFENLKMIHFGNDMLFQPLTAGVYHWKNSKLYYLIPAMVCGVNKSVYDIYSDVVCLDIGIGDKEAEYFFNFYFDHDHNYLNYEEKEKAEKYLTSPLKRKKQSLLMDKLGIDRFVCFGAGGAFVNNIQRIRRYLDIEYVVCNDKAKWGTKITGIDCISPDELKNLQGDSYVIITVHRADYVDQISLILNEMGIKRYKYFDSFLMELGMCKIY